MTRFQLRIIISNNVSGSAANTPDAANQCTWSTMNIVEDFDSKKDYLGTLCERGHDWKDTGKSLRSIVKKTCRACAVIKVREWKERNPERVKEYGRRNWKGNPTPKQWTKEEDLLLESIYATTASKDLLAIFPGRTIASLENRARKLGLTGKKALFWTKEEDDFLKSQYKQSSIADIAKQLPGRTSKSIRNRAYELGINGDASLPWSEAEDELLGRVYGSTRNKALLELFPGRTISAIAARASSLKICKPPGVLWTPEEDEIIEKYYSTTRANKFASLLPERTARSINRRAYQLGVKGTDNRKYTFDSYFFETPNLLNSYWAGFIAADGYISPTGQLCIALSFRDEGHLVQFQRHVGYTGSIRVKNQMSKQTGKTYPSAWLSIYSPKWSEDLLFNFAITTKKSLTLTPPIGLTREQELAFIAGYIDGDGSIMLKKDKRCPNYSHLVIEIIGTENVLQWIKAIFDEISSRPKKGTIVSEVRTKYRASGTCAYSIGGTRATSVALKLLQYPLPLLNRKWQKVLPFIELMLEEN